MSSSDSEAIGRKVENIELAIKYLNSQAEGTLMCDNEILRHGIVATDRAFQKLKAKFSSNLTSPELIIERFLNAVYEAS